MDNEITKCINEYMQVLKIKINTIKWEIECCKKNIVKKTTEEHKIGILYSSFYDRYILLKVKFYLILIFTFGISYKLMKNRYIKKMDNFISLLDFIDEKYNNIIGKLADYIQDDIIKKGNLEKYNIYFNQIELFIKCYNGMSKEERKCLNYKM